MISGRNKLITSVVVFFCSVPPVVGIIVRFVCNTNVIRADRKQTVEAYATYSLRTVEPLSIHLCSAHSTLNRVQSLR